MISFILYILIVKFYIYKNYQNPLEKNIDKKYINYLSIICLIDSNVFCYEKKKYFIYQRFSLN